MNRFLLAALFFLAVTPLHAQDYPSKPIVLVVPFAPGGSSDFISRLIGSKLTEAWKQQVVVESRPGGAGNIAMDAVQRAKPDGYTLILGHVGTLAVNPAMFAKLPYDPIKGFVPVSLLAVVPTVLVVNPNLPAKTFKEFIDLAKAKPGTIAYGSAGNGSSGHLAMEYLKQTAGIDIVHVPYKGTGPMVTDLLGGSTQATFTGATPLLPHIKQGKLRPLAVGDAKRVAALPDVPTVAESGYKGFETSQWYGIMAPAGTPDAIVRKLSAEINRILKSPDVIARLGADGSVARGSTPEEFAAFILTEQKRWGQVVKSAKITAD
ncbi:MAG: tripartite tricarboxylate transporter substrate binding protein [Casimicrobiaceae bacterium]